MDFHSLNIDLCTILDALEDPIHIIDTDGILVFANLAWEKLIGLPRESAVGLYINDAISRGNQGFYFSIEKDEDSRAAQFTHFDQKLFDSIALTALEKRKRVSMFAYSSSKNRFMLTSIPLYKGDRLQYVLTWCRDLTNFSQLCDDLQSAIEKNKLISEELEFYRKMTTSQNMIGKCPQMIALMKTVEYVAGTDATVLITGESGVGKEVLTNEIYQRSGRKGKPFIRVNCASIPESLMESELFGYERGAFTGAVKSKPGMFELANHGTLLLDEVGELPRALQPKLLRALQEREIIRVGGISTIPVDVRLIAATNQDLEAQPDSPPHSAAAGAGGRHPPSGRAFSGEIQRQIRQEEGTHRRGHANHEGVPLARKHPGDGEPAGASGDHRGGALAHRPPPDGDPGERGRGSAPAGSLRCLTEGHGGRL